MPLRLAVIGLGYVGLPLAEALSRKFPVTGFDEDAVRVEEIKSGHDRTGEVEESALLGSTLELTFEAGGLSGAPLFAPSTEMLRDMYRRTGGRLPLIGAGGVASGDDAYAKIKAGASLVQVYTALVFDGPPLIGRIKRDLAALLAADGVTRLAEAVGVDA